MDIIFDENLKHQFKNLVSDRCGLYFKDHDLKDLEKVLIQRMKDLKIHSPSAYYNKLAVSEDRENEFRELLNLLTVNHTYFFRNEPQFDVLKDRILPELMARRLTDLSATNNPSNKPRIRIWSAGCSTGEEPYTLAMVIQDVIPNIEDWDIQIIATDVSMNALAKARKGIYTETAMRLVDADHKERYFTERKIDKGAPQYEIRDSVKKTVRFDYFNLMDEEFPKKFDIIFCRNVVIYFELETTIKIMNKFHSSLAEDGYFFIGYSESLQFITEKFKMQDWKDAIYYIKSPPEMPGKREPKRLADQDLEKIIATAAKAEWLAEEKGIKIEKIALPPRKIEDFLVDAIKFFHLKQYNRALALIEEAHQAAPEAMDPYYLFAEVYVNQGNFQEAKEKLNAALSIHPMFTPAHYLLGYIFMEQENLEEAKRHLKKALYLDKDFSLAHFNLAHIYRKEGRLEDSIREYRNTLKILAQMSLGDIIAYSGGFNAATLVSVCKDNIERLKLSITV